MSFFFLVLLLASLLTRTMTQITVTPTRSGSKTQTGTRSSSATPSVTRTNSGTRSRTSTLTPSPSPSWQGLIVNTVAGGGSNFAGSVNGVGTAALFNNPSSVVLNPMRDTLFVADTGNHRIRAVNMASGAVSTLAGGGATGILSGTALINGIGSSALFNTPVGLTFSAFCSCLYIADTSNHALRLVQLDGTTTTLAGGGLTGGQSGFVNGIGTNAQMTSPYAVAVSSIGVAYVASTRMYAVYPDGTSVVIAGGASGITDGVGTNAGFSCAGFASIKACSVVIDEVEDIIYITGNYYGQLRKFTVVGDVGTVISYYNYNLNPLVSATGLAILGRKLYISTGLTIMSFDLSTLPVLTLRTVAGGLQGAGDGDSWVAGFSFIAGIAADPVNQTIYLSDTGNNKIRALNLATSLFSTFVGGGLGSVTGTGQGMNDGGFLDGGALFAAPHSIRALSNTTLVVTDSASNRLRFIDVCTGVITASASASVGTTPTALTVVPAGDTNAKARIYFADSSGHRIRSAFVNTSTGLATTPATLAGNGNWGCVNGLATTVGQVYGPNTVAVNASGYFFISDNCCFIRVVTPNNYIVPFSGTISGAAFLDGNATVARYGVLSALTFAPSGLLFAVDRTNHRIRVVSHDGGVITIAGSAGGSTNGFGTSAKFNSPSDIAFFGNTAYISESTGNSIRVITDVTVSPVEVKLLTGVNSGFSDGSLPAARFSGPTGVAIAGTTLFIADKVSIIS